jgi:regulator of sigma E protease
MLTFFAFLFAIGLLIAVHEFGHYRMAVACGVKVLRFSIGFGKTLLRWQPKGSATEFVICVFPIGGYVKMLDEREAPVADTERHLAFNTQPLLARVAIVAAGPFANLLLAVLLYSVVNWSGLQLPAAVLASPVAGSVADKAGLTGGERVLRAGFENRELQDIPSFDELRWLMTRAVLQGQNLHVVVKDAQGHEPSHLVLKLAELQGQDADEKLFQKIGIAGPFSEPVLGAVSPGSAAEKAGLRQGDRVRQVGDAPVVDAQQLRHFIRASVRDGKALPKVWTLIRSGTALELLVEVEPKQEAELWVGKIGAYVGSLPEMVTVQYGLTDGLWRGAVHTWDVSVLTLGMMGNILIGQVSLKNLSGPLMIADYAGKSASMGLSTYLIFLALISVSLGVLNLLPLPVLDGGHLMYYLWEWITGKPVSDVSMERLQRGGFAVLLVMMSIAIFNDINRLFG